MKTIASIAGGICLAVMTIPVAAQGLGESRRRYVPFEIDPSSLPVLKDRLQLEQHLAPVKDLIKKIANNPKLLGDPKQFKDLDLKDPKFQKALLDWIEGDPELKKALRERFKMIGGKLPPELQSLQKELRKIDGKALEKQVTEDVPATNAPESPAKTEPDPLAKFAAKAMKQAEETSMGDWLRDSPAWRQALLDFEGALKNPQPASKGSNGWIDQFAVPEEKLLDLGKETARQLRKLPRPRLENWNLNPGFPVPGAPALPQIPSVSFPGTGGRPLPRLGLAIVWLLFAVLFVFVAWRLLRRKGKTTEQKNERAGLGPWPIRPEQVSTRTDLVRAFDYLAVWSLGQRVRCANHQAVANEWNEKAPHCAGLSGALAQIYEESRYTKGMEELSPAQCDQARQALLQLTEAF